MAVGVFDPTADVAAAEVQLFRASLPCCPGATFELVTFGQAHQLRPPRFPAAKKADCEIQSAELARAV
jgi:hypothetical protein